MIRQAFKQQIMYLYDYNLYFSVITSSSGLLSVLYVLSSEFLQLALHLIKLVLISQRGLLNITNAGPRPRPALTNTVIRFECLAPSLESKKSQHSHEGDPCTEVANSDVYQLISPSSSQAPRAQIL